MLRTLKRFIIGSPLPTQQIEEKRLNKIRAMAAFSPDALSSIAYANQEIYLGLVVAGSTGLLLAWPVGLAITAVLIIAALSYYQTIQAYTNGGGSYVVARENLGTLPGLVAASALMIDYILTAAVSLTAGVAAIASAFPPLWNYRVEASLFLLLIILIVNLRGLRESGSFMAVPVYLFLGTFLPMIVYGVIRLLSQGPDNLAAIAPSPTEPLTAFLVLRAFAAGCTALTGIESISNGVPAFRPPESKNAGQTLIVMAVLMGALFIGSIGLTQALAVIPAPNETILSALVRHLLGRGPLYLLIQASTLLILTVAANTSFAGFPRVASILAHDGFLPRQLAVLGDRLVFANEIIALAIATAALIILFDGDPHLLVPLFAIGAFLAFTLSQSGMVLHWYREKGKNWRVKAIANGAGAFATGVTLLVIGVSKFTQGAWITILVIPCLIFFFLMVRRHYRLVAEQLSLRKAHLLLNKYSSIRAVVPISGVHRGMIDAVRFAETIASKVVAIYIEIDPGSAEDIRCRWDNWFPHLPLVVSESPYRSIVRPFLEFLDRTDQGMKDSELMVVVLPEFLPAHPWQAFLHNRTSNLIKKALLNRKRKFGYTRVIIDVPFHLVE